MNHEAVATFDNGQTLSFELEDHQVKDFISAVFNKLVYNDEKTGVICWLPPDRLLNLIIKPNMESPLCQKSQPLEVVSDLLT